MNSDHRRQNRSGAQDKGYEQQPAIAAVQACNPVAAKSPALKPLKSPDTKVDPTPPRT